MGWSLAVLGVVCAWVLVGCAEPCLGLSEVPIEDPFDLATDEDETLIRETMDEFVRWTLTPKLCANRVTIRWIQNESIGGYYFGDEDRIVLDPSVSDFEYITRHELCHAWDSVNGDISLKRPDLFDWRTVTYNEHYPTKDARTTEAFARACHDAPVRTGIDLGLELACGLDLVEPRTRWMLEHLWRGYELPLVYRGAIQAEHRSVPIQWSHGSLHGMVAAGGRVFVLAHRDADRRQAGRSPAGEPRGKDWWDEPGEALEASTSHLIELDADSGEVVAELNVSSLLAGAQRGEVIYSGDERPLLVAVGPDQTRGWLVDPANGQQDELPLPALESFPMNALVHSDHAWLIAVPRGSEDLQLLEVDLLTGKSQKLDLLPEGRSWEWWGQSHMLVAGDELIVIHNKQSGRPMWVSYGIHTGETERFKLQKATDSTAYGLAALPDGRMVLGLRVFRNSNMVRRYDPLLVIHPDHDVWQMDPSTCAKRWYEDYGYASPYGERGLMPWGDGVVFPTEVDGVWSFVHMELPPL